MDLMLSPLRLGAGEEVRGQGIEISPRTETRLKESVDLTMESWGKRAEGNEVESNSGKAP